MGFIITNSLNVSFLLLLVLSLCGRSMAEDGEGKFVRVVQEGRSHARIIVPKTASKQLRNSAKVLSEYIRDSTGASIPILIHAGAGRNRGITIHVGVSSYVKELNLPPEGMDGDGFVITFPDQKNIVICGPSDWGTEFAIYEFLERYVGVRWLLPGPNGDHVPKHFSLSIPIEEVKEEPAFFSRHLFGMRGKAQNNWARHNRLHGRMEFHHNLFRLFPPEDYSKAHAKFFPLLDGKRFVPPPRRKDGWQPCFSAPGIVEEAVRNISEHFSRNPEKMSYSLGVNDGWGYCECERCLEGDRSSKNFLGLRDVSDKYFEWANKVVGGVVKEHPNKWFGCLAYAAIAGPPSNRTVHPRIIPYMTYDRMKWVDKDLETQGKKITSQWVAKTSKLGWYDYIYGTPYCVPRVYPHKMAQYYQYASSHRVEALTAEAYPNWGEGPKLYIALKLQWNPNLNVDALLKDWYVCAVGKDAAPYLGTYYDHWEIFWTKRVKKSKWFARWGQYLKFDDPRYLDVVTFEDISKSRGLLETVLAKAKTEKQRERAKLLLRAFEYYEASALSYLGLVKNMRETGKNKQFYQDMNRKRYQLVDAFEEDPVLRHPVRFDEPRFRQLSWGNHKQQNPKP